MYGYFSVGWFDEVDVGLRTLRMGVVFIKAADSILRIFSLAPIRIIFWGLVLMLRVPVQLTAFLL